MTFLRRILFIAVVLSACDILSGQKLLNPELNSFQGRMIHYPVTEPGADISTTRLFFDSKGFLWTGTYSGLYRYDGNKYTGYGFNSFSGTGLAGHLVSDICEDSAGIMWIGTSGALNRLDQKTGMIRHFMPDSGNYMSSNNRIRFIRHDTSGLMWLLTDGDVFTFNKTTCEFKRYCLDGPVASWTNKSGRFLEDSRGRIWIVSSHGLFRYSREEDRFVAFRNNPTDPSSISSNQTECITEDYSGVLWCGTTGGGLNRITDPEHGKFEKIRFDSKASPGRKLDTILALLPDRNGLLWLFGNGVFASYSPETGETRSYLVSPVNEMFRNFKGHRMLFEDAFQDKEGLVWFLQRQGIVLSFNPRTEKLRLFNVPNWVIFDWIRDDYGSIWFGCANGNNWRLMLNSLPFQSVQVYNMFNVAIYNNPRIVEDNNKKIWLALSTGIYTADFNSDHDISIRQVRLPIGDTVVNCIMKDRKGNIWSGLNKNRIVRMNSTNNAYKIFYLPENIKDIVYNIIEDRHGNLWFLSYYKIFVRYAGRDKIETFSVQDNDLSEALKEGIYDIMVDGNENLWLALFADGAYSYNLNNKSVTKYFSEPGTDLMAGDYCIRIKEDGKGRIWILFASGGLYLVNLETEKLAPVRLLDKVPVGMGFTDLFIDRNGRLMVYHSYGLTLYNPDNDDIRHISYNQKPGSYSSCQLSSGHILNLSGQELKLFHDTIPFNRIVPDVYLTGLSVNENDQGTLSSGTGDITALSTIKLKHYQNNLRLEFAALNFLYPENNSYRYFMSGVDKDTVYLNNYHPVEYKKLKPGNYKFWFTGSNNDGIWNLEGKTLDIRISPPLTRSLPAYFIYAILFLILASAFTRRHFNKLIADRTRLEDEVHSRTVELEKKNQQIEQLDRMKTRFFTEISHEIRTPLSLIMGPVDSLISGNGRIDDIKRAGLMETIRRNSMRLLNLVNQLLDISRIDAGKMKITLAESDLLKSLRILIYEYLSTAENRRIKYIVDVPDETYVTFFDKDKIEKIVSNLLSNAFKFTPANGAVFCRAEIIKPDGKGSPAVLSLTVQDTGVGISKENLDKIFDRFYRVEGQWEKDGRGTGIGLSLTEEFVTLLHGSIEVTSEKDAGSTFTVRIPVGKDHLSPEEYVVTETHPYGTGETETDINHLSMLQEKELDANCRKSQLLIIEDNRDLRGFLKDNLSREYLVYEAGNGREGINIAFAKIPDLVITDIIMPDADGIEVCRKLKNDERTSHIPVIILTAKNAQDVKIEGLISGADDFLSKPFDINELRIRISNLLVQRAKLRYKYGLIAEFGDYIDSSETVDNLFMKKVHSIINENINNFDFDVGVLQEKLGMSRIHLYRKLKALTGLSPSSIIHYYRMQCAAKMIHDKKLNLTEIALSIGISNPSYFSRSFREFYGVSPKDFLNHPEDVKKVKNR